MGDGLVFKANFTFRALRDLSNLQARLPGFLWMRICFLFSKKATPQPLFFGRLGILDLLEKAVGGGGVAGSPCGWFDWGKGEPSCHFLASHTL